MKKEKQKKGIKIKKALKGVGIGVAGIAIGYGIKTWRSNKDYVVGDDTLLTFNRACTGYTVASRSQKLFDFYQKEIAPQVRDTIKDVSFKYDKQITTMPDFLDSVKEELDTVLGVIVFKN